MKRAADLLLACALPLVARGIFGGGVLTAAASSSFSAVGPTRFLLLVPAISLQAELRSAGGVTVVDDASTACRFTNLQQDPLREIAPSGEILSCGVVVRFYEHCGHDEVYGVSKMARSGLKPRDIC